MDLKKLYRVSDYEWDIPKSGKMNVDGYIIASQKLIKEMDDTVYNQLVNVASLPGIVYRAIGLPDAHSGYGFPIGGVAAFDMSNGVVCVGGVGFDINCGVRTVTTNLIYQDIEKKVESLLKEFYKAIPAGVGSKGKVSISKKDLFDLLTDGAKWLIENRGMGKKEDLDFIEDYGCLSGALPDALSPEALKREKNQLGTLGSGNHYVEIQIVDEIFDIERARVYGLFKNQVVVTIHSGSRGLGHQVGTDFLKIFAKAAKKYGIEVPERELASVPISSPEGQQYIGAVKAASNFAFANRQAIGYAVHKVFNDVIKDVDTNVMYDIGHNTLKEEEHRIGSTRRNVLVHRKGSTRNFPGRMVSANMPYRVSGLPVIVGGSMGTYTYIMSGSEESMAKTFGSTIHGAGREMSRTKAKSKFDYDTMQAELMEKGVHLKVKDKLSAVEEAPGAYKDIEEVIKSINKSGISIRVARLKPIGVIKG
jgi:tRNA-splicing ligase RtcB